MNSNNIIGKSFKNTKTSEVYIVEEVNDNVVVVSKSNGELTNISIKYLLNNCECLNGTLQVESLICG